MKKYLYTKIKVILCTVLIAVIIPQSYAYALWSTAFKLSYNKADSLFEKTSVADTQMPETNQGRMLTDSVENVRQAKNNVLEKVAWAVTIAERVYKGKTFNLSNETYLSHANKVALISLQPRL